MQCPPCRCAFGAVLQLEGDRALGGHALGNAIGQEHVERDPMIAAGSLLLRVGDAKASG
jgi:hypothetical protein